MKGRVAGVRYWETVDRGDAIEVTESGNNVLLQGKVIGCYFEMRNCRKDLCKKVISSVHHLFSG